MLGPLCITCTLCNCHIHLQLALRMAGLALVYFSTWTLWPLSATVMALLIASIMGGRVIKYVPAYCLSSAFHDDAICVPRCIGDAALL